MQQEELEDKLKDLACPKCGTPNFALRDVTVYTNFNYCYECNTAFDDEGNILKEDDDCIDGMIVRAEDKREEAEQWARENLE